MSGILANRLVLGTAQLGMAYGVANKNGKPERERCEDVVKIAWEGGIHDFDTAQAYGDSERNLGLIFKKLNISDDVKVTTKVGSHLLQEGASALKKAVEESLRRLKISRLHALLLHGEDCLGFWNEEIGNMCSGLVDGGFSEHIGISVYSPEKAIEAIKTDGISVVQIPSNILDRRFENANIFRLADLNSKTIFVRSVFLQGLLLMKTIDLTPAMAFAVGAVQKCNDLAHEAGMPIEQLALGYVRDAYPNAHIIFGAETPEQVHSNLASWKKELPVVWRERIKKRFSNVELKIINPSLWSGE